MASLLNRCTHLRGSCFGFAIHCLRRFLSLFHELLNLQLQLLDHSP